MRSPLRPIYRTIIRLHPAAFRDEFGAEMLWIFDEESREGSLAHLFFDGVRSVVVQRIKPRTRLVVEGCLYCDVSASVPLFRFAQAGFILFSGVVFLSILGSTLVPKIATRHWFLNRVKITASLPETKSAKL